MNFLLFPILLLFPLALSALASIEQLEQEVRPLISEKVKILSEHLVIAEQYESGRTSALNDILKKIEKNKTEVNAKQMAYNEQLNKIYQFTNRALSRQKNIGQEYRELVNNFINQYHNTLPEVVSQIEDLNKYAEGMTDMEVLESKLKLQNILNNEERSRQKFTYEVAYQLADMNYNDSIYKAGMVDNKLLIVDLKEIPAFDKSIYEQNLLKIHQYTIKRFSSLSPILQNSIKRLNQVVKDLTEKSLAEKTAEFQKEISKITSSTDFINAIASIKREFAREWQLSITQGYFSIIKNRFLIAQKIMGIEQLCNDMRTDKDLFEIYKAGCTIISDKIADSKHFLKIVLYRDVNRAITKMKKMTETFTTDDIKLLENLIELKKAEEVIMKYEKMIEKVKS